MKHIIVTFFTVFILTSAFAQPDFIVKGKIEFERKTNLHKQLDNEEDETFRNMIKKSVPQTKTNYFDLYFNGSKTIYTPGREAVTTQKVPEWMDGPATDNIVYTDLTQQIYNSQKTVFEDVFNIQDTVRKINWKITPDTRTIAGFDCRRATAVIMDSVFVVAFYSDQIVAAGGPESFAGLPGMILGLAIPRLNTTWFATKLELIDVKETSLVPPKKGKKTNVTALKEQLKSVMKGWGKQGDRNIWQIMI
jgi:GLPGLI family protein